MRKDEIKTPLKKAEELYDRNSDKFAVEIDQFLHKKFPKFSAFTDFQGVLHLHHKKRSNDSICATPFWESEAQIPVDVVIFREATADGDATFSSTINLDPEEINYIAQKGFKGLVEVYKRYIPVIIGTYKAKRKSFLG